MPEAAPAPAQQYVVGIDLGTSNTVVAYAKAGSDDIRVFDIDQLVSPGEVAARPLLPSVRYHAAPGELSGDDLQLPWQTAASAAARRTVFGRLAATLGAQVPGRLVASAKSWLSHASVDRTAPILPHGAAAAPTIRPAVTAPADRALAATSLMDGGAQAQSFPSA